MCCIVFKNAAAPSVANAEIYLKLIFRIFISLNIFEIFTNKFNSDRCKFLLNKFPSRVNVDSLVASPCAVNNQHMYLVIFGDFW